MSETPSEIPGWYITFQTAVLQQLPRLEDIDESVATHWIRAQAGLQVALKGSLSPLSPRALWVSGERVLTIPERTFYAKEFEGARGPHSSHIYPQFVEWFLQGDGKVERSSGRLIGMRSYAAHPKHGTYGAIKKELGGFEAAELPLSVVYSLMNRGQLWAEQAHNLFFVRDMKGILRIVDIFTSEDSSGWFIEAYDVGDTAVLQSGQRFVYSLYSLPMK